MSKRKLSGLGPADAKLVPDEGLTKVNAPPPDERRDKIMAFLEKRGAAWSTGVRIMSETSMRSAELYPVLDKMIGDGLVEFMFIGEEPVQRQVFRRRHKHAGE